MVRREVRETGRGTSRTGPSGRPVGHPACRPPRISPFFLGHGNAAGVQCVFRRAGRGPGRRGQRSSGKSRSIKLGVVLRLPFTSTGRG